MYFESSHSENNILIRIANKDESIFNESIDLAAVCEQDQYGEWHTALSVACQTGSFSYVNRLLISEGVRKNAGSSDNRALTVAASLGKVDVVRRLTEITDVRNSLNNKYTFYEYLMSPIEKHHWAVVDLLMTFLRTDSMLRLVNMIVDGPTFEIGREGYLRLLANDAFRVAIEKKAKDQSGSFLIGVGVNFDLLGVLIDEVPICHKIAGAQNNCVLRAVLQFQKTELMEKLLTLDDVKAEIKRDYENVVFKEAVRVGNKQIITRLLEIDSIRLNALNALEDVCEEASLAQGGSIADWLRNQLAPVNPCRPS